MAKKFFDITSPSASSGERGEARIKSRPKPGGLIEEPVFIYQKKKNRGKGLMLGAALGIFVAAGAFLSQFYLSKAEVEIWPETKKLNFKTEIAVDAGYNEPSSSRLAQKIIAGKSLTEEKETSKEFLASGIVEKKEFARGKIKINNKSKNPITLIKNTRFLSDEGKQFHSLKESTVPAKGYLDGVDVEADAAGEEYNIGPSKFSAPNLRKYSSTLFYDIWAESSAAMAGGFSGKAPQVTEEDIKNAEAEILEKLFADGKGSLSNAARAQDYILPEEAMKQELIEKLTFAKAGQETKSFIFKAKIKSSGLAFKKSDAEKLSQDFVYSQIGLDKKLVEKSLNLNYTVKENNLGEGKIIIGIEISGDIYQDMDMRGLKDKLKGRSAFDGKNFLEKDEEISRVEVNLWPPWVKRVPKNNEKIEIELKLD